MPSADDGNLLRLSASRLPPGSERISTAKRR